MDLVFHIVKQELALPVFFRGALPMKVVIHFVVLAKILCH
jgi:hypothetical protein